MSWTVSGVGARTPLGLDAVQTGMLYRAGFAAMGEAHVGGRDITMCACMAIDPEITADQRLIELGAPALCEALAVVQGASAMTLLLCFDEARLAEAAAGQLLSIARRTVPDTRLELCVESPLADLERLSDRELLLLGGLHSDHDEARIERLVDQGRLYDNEHVDAVIPGEAAAFCVLGKSGHGVGRLLALGRGQARARDDNNLPAATARGLTAAMRQATRTMEDRGERAGWLIGDLSFETWRHYEWQSMFVRAAGVLEAPYRVDFPAQRLGTLGAAAAPLSIALAVEAWRAGWAPARRALVTTACDSGERGALLMESTI